MAATDEQYPELNILRGKLSEYIDNTVSTETAYDTIPSNKIKGLKTEDAQQTVLVYQNLLRDLRVKPDTPISKILFALEQYIETPPFDTFSKYIAKRYAHLSTSQQASLIGWFCKIYSSHNRLPFTPFWPPPNYPTDAPPLYTVTGYTAETTLESDVRVLTQLMVRTRSSYADLQSFLDALRETDPTMGDIMVRLNSLLRTDQELSVQELNDLYRHEEVDHETYKILVRAQGHQRLLEGIMNTTPLQFLLKEANYSNYCESTAISFNYTPFELYSLTVGDLLDRNQMYIAFFPRCGEDSSPLNFNKSETLGIQLDNTSWIEFNYDFPSSELCSAYNNIRDPDIGKEFQKIGVVQGYRTESFPHPSFVIAVSKGIRDAHPRVKAKWPEWFDDAARTRWVERVMTQWELDIRAMPASTLYERNLKEIQQLFYLYAKREINAPITPPPSVAANLQARNVTEAPSPIPAMLSRLLMNANRDPNAAYVRFNRNVRPFVKNPKAATIKARKRGFFTGESKNSYRKTLKAQLNELLRNTGSTYTADASLAGIHAMAMDEAVSTSAVYERMKEWVSQYAMRNLSTVGVAMPIDPKINGVANLFKDLTPASSRSDLQHAAELALTLMKGSITSIPADVTPLLADLTALKERGKGRSAADFYKLYTQILRNYAAIIATLPADVASTIRSVRPPPSRGFFARMTGAPNTQAWSVLYGNVLDAIAALERIPVPVAPSKNQSVNLTTQIYKVTSGASSVAPTYYRVLRENGRITSVIQIPATNVDLPVTNATEDELRTLINEAVASQKAPASQGFLPVTIRKRKPLAFLPSSQPKLGDQWAAVPGQGGGARKTARHGRTMKRTRKQRGGAATSMPLAWYQPGAQFQGTVADPTGVGLAGSSASWARSALPGQGGGRRTRKTRRQRGGFHRQRRGVTDHLEQMGGFHYQRSGVTNKLVNQFGGFSPSVMGAGFASVGMRLLPAAAYMGYNQFNNFRKRTHRRQRK